ncbi:CRASP family complement regulator-acquiring lipoprotein (plasmid) [Borreliella sinica]|uniref:CRASP family complement regulator-acquiring lipoprotein n=1 Tax=Borreliella sinica TaxID=87162 RepID=UPI003AF1B850
MKYHTICNIFIFLFLNACTPDFKTNPFNDKNSKSNTEMASNQQAEKERAERERAEREQNKKTLLNNLINSIESANAHKEKYIKKMEEEPADQYGISAFKDLLWTSSESVASNTERSIRYRRRIYTFLSLIDDDKLKEFAYILDVSKASVKYYAIFSDLGYIFDNVTDHLYPKKDALDKLDISDLEKLKQSFDTILSTIKFVSETSRQILLDYQADKNLIKKDVTKLESYLDTFYDQMREKVVEAKKLEEDILLSKSF